MSIICIKKGEKERNRAKPVPNLCETQSRNCSHRYNNQKGVVVDA